MEKTQVLFFAIGLPSRSRHGESKRGQPSCFATCVVSPPAPVHLSMTSLTLSSLAPLRFSSQRSASRSAQPSGTSHTRAYDPPRHPPRGMRPLPHASPVPSRVVRLRFATLREELGLVLYVPSERKPSQHDGRRRASRMNSQEQGIERIRRLAKQAERRIRLGRALSVGTRALCAALALAIADVALPKGGVVGG